MEKSIFRIIPKLNPDGFFVITWETLNVIMISFVIFICNLHLFYDYEYYLNEQYFHIN